MRAGKAAGDEAMSFLTICSSTKLSFLRLQPSKQFQPRPQQRSRNQKQQQLSQQRLNRQQRPQKVCLSHAHCQNLSARVKRKFRGFSSTRRRLPAGPSITVGARATLTTSCRWHRAGPGALTGPDRQLQSKTSALCLSVKDTAKIFLKSKYLLL